MGTITTYNLRHIRLIQVSLSKAQCDSYRCERLKVSASGGIVLDGYYPAGALSVEEHPGDAAEVYACYYDDYTFLGSRASLPEYKFVKPEGFSDAAVSAPAGRAGSGLNDRTVSLTWDEAGRLKSDPTRNISNISYNSLGLPERTRYSNGDFLTCSYDGFGRKLSAEYSQTSINTTTKQRREYYAGGLVVCDDSVETVRFAGGYFDRSDREKRY